MPETPDFETLDAAIHAGHAAQETLANYYDSFTEEQIDAEFEDAEPVQITTPRRGIGAAWTVRLDADELKDVLHAAKGLGLSVGAYLKHLALLDARGHVLSVGTATCEHLAISGVREAACGVCGPLPVTQTVIVTA